jgi:uncharacterized protein (TIGR00251 family)
VEVTKVTHVLSISVKAVPGASRDEIAGMLGDRLKVRVQAPAEEGKANRAICNLIAKRLGISTARVTVESGRSRAEKTLRIEGASPNAVDSLMRSK